MHQFGDYKQLRVTNDMSSDPDFAATQAVPSPLGEVERGGVLRGSEPVRIKVEVVLQWLDAAGSVLTGDRGTFDMQVVRVTTQRGDPTKVVVDSAVLTGQLAHRPTMIDDILPGDAFTVRLTNMVRAGASQARVLYREIV